MQNIHLSLGEEHRDWMGRVYTIGQYGTDGQDHEVWL